MVPEGIVNWYGHYLNNMNVSVSLGGSEFQHLITKGTPQGRIPLLEPQEEDQHAPMCHHDHRVGKMQSKHQDCCLSNIHLLFLILLIQLYENPSFCKIDFVVAESPTLSPLMWNLLVDDLLRRLQGFSSVKPDGYADDRMFLVSGKGPETLLELA